MASGASRPRRGASWPCPRPTGSSTTATVLLEALRAGTAPAAILTTGPDTFLALAAIIAQEMYGQTLPLVVLSKEDFARLESGASASVNQAGEIELVD